MLEVREKNWIRSKSKQVVVRAQMDWTRLFPFACFISFLFIYTIRLKDLLNILFAKWHIYGWKVQAYRKWTTEPQQKKCDLNDRDRWLCNILQFIHAGVRPYWKFTGPWQRWHWTDVLFVRLWKRRPFLFRKRGRNGTTSHALVSRRLVTNTGWNFCSTYKAVSYFESSLVTFWAKFPWILSYPFKYRCRLKIFPKMNS